MFLLTMLASIHIPDQDLVYAARYYYQGARRSYSQIYLCRHDGTKRIQVTNEERDSIAPMWVDQTHIAYFHQGVVADKDAFPSGKLSTFRAVVYDVNNGTSKVLRGYRASSEGWLLSTRDSILTAQLGVGPTSLKPRFQVTPTKFTIATTKEHHDHFPPAIYTPGKDRVFHYKDQDWSLSWVHSEPHVVVNNKFQLLGDSVDRVLVGKQGVGILVTKSENPPSQSLYQFTDGYQTCKLVATGLRSVDVDPNSMLWSATRTDGSVGKLKNGRQVGASQLVVGNLATGKQWTVARGLVKAGASQLRP